MDAAVRAMSDCSLEVASQDRVALAEALVFAFSSDYARSLGWSVRPGSKLKHFGADLALELPAALMSSLSAGAASPGAAASTGCYIDPEPEPPLEVLTLPTTDLCSDDLRVLLRRVEHAMSATANLITHQGHGNSQG